MMKMQLVLLVSGILISSCAPQLPVSYNKKSLHEKIFVENRDNRYILHSDTAIQNINIESENGATLKFVKNPDSITLYTSKSQRPVFKLYGSDTIIVTNRNISFKKVVNFRDIGGLKTTEGKTVKWGKIFRSDNLSTLKDNEFKKFNALNIKTVYDLRTSSEITPKQDHLPGNVKYVAFPIINDNGDLLSKMKSKVINGEVSEKQSHQMMLNLYKTSVTDNILLKDLIRKITDSDAPVLYHCSAGKDRTGVITALLLSILKVDREIIINEYMLSNYYRKQKVKSMLRKAGVATIIKPRLQTKVIENFMSVDRDYINAVFDVIDNQYGGTDNFIANQLGITDDERFLIIAKFTY